MPFTLLTIFQSCSYNQTVLIYKTSNRNNNFVFIENIEEKQLNITAIGEEDEQEHVSWQLHVKVV